MAAYELVKTKVFRLKSAFSQVLVVFPDLRTTFPSQRTTFPCQPMKVFMADEVENIVVSSFGLVCTDLLEPLAGYP